MGYDVKEASVWPVNEQGEIVVQSGIGGSVAVGGISSSAIPIDPDTGKVVFANVPTIRTDVGGNVIGMQAKGVVISDGGYPTIYNYNPKNYKKSRIAMSKMRAGLSNMLIARIGDSTESGKNSGSGGADRAGSVSNRLSTMLNETSVFGSTASPRTSVQSWWGDNNTGVLSTYDARVAYTGGWATGGGGFVLGGNALKTSTTGVLTFTPTSNVDTFEVWYINNSAAQFNWTIGANNGAITQSNNGAYTKLTVVGASVALTPITITWVSGTVWIGAIRAYNAAVKEVSVAMMSGNSLDSSHYAKTGSPWWPAQSLPTISPDLTFIRLGINDWNQGTPVTIAQYSANIQTIITAAKQTGDVILVTPVPSQVTGTMTLVGQKAYVDELFKLAQTNSCAIIDLWSSIESYEISNPLGYYSDNAHPTASGYIDIAKSDFELLRRM